MPLVSHAPVAGFGVQLSKFLTHLCFYSTKDLVDTSRILVYHQGRMWLRGAMHVHSFRARSREAYVTTACKHRWIEARRRGLRRNPR